MYHAIWAGPCDFDEVLISPVMIQDHMPDNMLKALTKVSSQHHQSLKPDEARRDHSPLARSSSLRPGIYEPLDNEESGVARSVMSNGVHEDPVGTCPTESHVTLLVNAEVHE